ncbi:MAG: metallophosphoesterase, partial [Acidobacteriota bacterium]
VWRAATLPWLAAALPRRTLLVVAAALWSLYVVGRVLDRLGLEALAYPAELGGAAWMGVLFLLFAGLVVADLITGFGLLLPASAPALRTAGLGAGMLLSAIALFQGMRPPVITSYEMPLAGLPASLDGTVLVQLSDLHLGTLLGEKWLARVIAQVAGERPDIVVITGDLVDGDTRHAERLLPRLKTLQAPLGVWAVTGNHEFYAGLDRSIRLLEQAGFRVLRDQAVAVAPGLVLAGVDDLTARRQFGDRDQHAIECALSDRPPGATVLLSHTPWQATTAATLGVSLMLSGHTHEGQIWPFSYLVRLTYPFLGGAYAVGDMTLVVSRATGTWGPRMRLWRPAEIVKIVLRAGSAHRPAGLAASAPGTPILGFLPLGR